MQLRQTIAGDRVLSAQNFNDVIHTSGGNYIPNSLSLFVNGIEYPLSAVNSFGFGFLNFNTPIPLKGGDLVRLQSNVASITTDVFTTRSTDFTISAVDASICNNTSDVTVSYNDIIRIFLGDIDSDFTLELNGNPLSMSNFVYQQYQTSVFESYGTGGFRGTINTNNSSAFSILNYAPTNNLIITPIDGYFTVRLGVIELIFANGNLNRSNFAEGDFDIGTGITYLPEDVFEIISTNTEYVVEHNGDEIYSFDKEITLTVTAGSITPNPATLNSPSVWTLPVVAGIQTVTAEFFGGGVNTSTIVNVDFCRATADDKTEDVPRGMPGWGTPTLTGTVPDNCTSDGFIITSLPECAILTLDDIPIEIDQVIDDEDAGNIFIDVLTECPSTVSYTYVKKVTGDGCANSEDAIVVITVISCAETWVNDGSPICVDCIRVQPQINTTQYCSGGPSTRNLPLGDNSACLQASWSDNGQVRCNNCEEQKQQINTNPCFTGTQTRWVSNPSGNACNEDPIWTVEETACSTSGIISYGLNIYPFPFPTGPGVGAMGITTLATTDAKIVRINKQSIGGKSIENIVEQIIASPNAIKGKIYVKFSEEVIIDLEITAVTTSSYYYDFAVNPKLVVPDSYESYLNLPVIITPSLTETCFQVNTERNTNPCSSSYNALRVINTENSCGTALPPKWRFLGDISCENCNTLIQNEDIELCSNTYGEITTTANNEVNAIYHLAYSPIARGLWFNNTTSMEVGDLISVRISTQTSAWVPMTNILNTLITPNPNKIRITIIHPTNDNIQLIGLIEGSYMDGLTLLHTIRVTSYTNSDPLLPALNFYKVKFTILEGATICDVEPDWVSTGQIDCIACENKEYFIDENPCSPTYQVIQLFDSPEGDVCNTTPNYITTNNIRCNGEIEEVLRANNNPCYIGEDQNLWVATGNTCFCEKTLKVKNICQPDRDIVGVVVKRTDSPTEQNRLIEFDENTITFKTTPSHNEYLIIIVDDRGVENRITLTTQCTI